MEEIKKEKEPIRGEGGKWLPGKSGNPGGMKALPKEVKESRKISLAEFCEKLVSIRNLTPIDLKDKNLEEISIAERAMIQAYVKFDYRAIKYYEDRLWGKAKESIELTGKDGEALDFRAQVEIEREQFETIKDEIKRFLEGKQTGEL